MGHTEGVNGSTPNQMMINRMAKRLCCLFLLVSCSAVFCQEASERSITEGKAREVGAQEKAEIDEVLFIGNSYTYAYNMPMMVEAMLQVKTDAARVRMLAKGAYALDMHWAEEGVASPRQVIKNDAWDAVVLQDQSGRPAVDPAATVADVVRFEKLIRARGARTILFMTWGHGGEGYREMSKQLALTYCRAAVKTGAEIAPVGLAWFRALQKDKSLELHTPDHSHPNVKGSYLAACVFYATLTGRSALGLPATLLTKNRQVICRLDARDARWLQQVADDTVKSFQGIEAAKKLIAAHEKTLQRWENFDGKLHKGITPEMAVKEFGKPHAASNNHGKVIQVYRLLDDRELWLIYNKGKSLDSANFQPQDGEIVLPEAPE